MTKEDKLKLLQKQYNDVLEKELSVYEQNKQSLDQFNKDTKAIHTEYKKEIKALQSDDKKVVSTYQKKQKERNELHQEKLQELDEKRNQVTTQIEDEQMALDGQTKDLEEDLKKQLQKDQKANKKATEEAQKELQKAIEKADKTIEQIKEKGIKDQATFDQKLTDLKTKYEAKIDSLNEKEQTKLQKLQEAYDKKVESIQEDIIKEQEKFDEKLKILLPTYEEELAEIDEKINLEKAEFDKKYANIKTSADKRIAVREKHLQRALEDNDQRSAKQHKKDIAKFQKEADQDLQVLEKNYKQQQTVSSEYRLNFIKEHFEKRADLEEKLAEFKAKKQLDIDQLTLQLQHSLSQTKSEYETLRSKELNEFNQDYAQTREKQETVRHQQDVDTVQQEINQEKEQATFDSTILILAEEAKRIEETYQKNERVRIHSYEVQSKQLENKLQQELTKLNAQQDIADKELERDLIVLEFEEAKEHHTKKYEEAVKEQEAFKGYLDTLHPKVLVRNKELVEFELLEIEQRTTIKLQVLQKEQEQLDLEKDVFLQEVNATYEQEKAFYDQKIEELAGEQSTIRDQFVEQEETKLKELRKRIEPLTSRKDRKLRRDLELELEQKEQVYQSEKNRMDIELKDTVGVYQDALDQLTLRHNAALKNINEYYQAATKRILDTIELVKDTKDKEQTQATTRFDQTEASISTFDLQTVQLNQQQLDGLETYLSEQLKREDEGILEANKTCEHAREARNEVLDQHLAELTKDYQQLSADKQQYIETQEAQFEQFVVLIEQQIESLKNDLQQRHASLQSTFDAKKQEIMKLLAQELTVIQNNLQSQTNEFNKTMARLEQEEQQQKIHLESEQKRIKLENETTLKSTLQAIQSTLQQNIKSI